MAHGKTLVLWTLEIDKFVTVIPTTSPSVAPIIFQIPKCRPSVHVGIYLPTYGHNAEFLIAMAALHVCLDFVIDIVTDIDIYIGRDTNINPKNSHNITQLDIQHNTHHHFNR